MKNYVVITADSRLDIKDKNQKIAKYKEFATMNAALKCAQKRREMISQQVLCIDYYVYDIANRILTK